MNGRTSLVALLLVIGSVPVAGAATFAVTTTVDAVDANPGDAACLTAAGQCSLRAAIQEANALAGADVITLPAGVYPLNIGSQGEDAAAGGDLDITSEITINGAAANTTIVDGMKRDRVFHVLLGGNATINKLTIRNGWANDNGVGGGLANRSGVVTLNECNIYRNTGSGTGGGLDNSSFDESSQDFSGAVGVMTINRSTIRDNVVAGVGGGIANNNGILIINDSTIRDNTAGQFASVVMGGGIYNTSFSTIPGLELSRLEVNRSLITGHSVITDGGGIYHLVGNITINNSTISDNEAKRNGGGVFIAAGANGLTKNRIVHTTIAKNRAYANDTSSNPMGVGGGGLVNGNPSNPGGQVVTSIENSLITANGVGGNCYNLGTLAKQGNFLGDDSCLNVGDSPSGVVYTAAQVGLGELKNNGGPVLTHALLPGSLALGAASNALCTAVDQRGYSRPATGCDAGAFEVEGIAPAVPVPPTPAPLGSVSTDVTNRVPLVFPMPSTAVAGTPMHGVLNGADSDGDPLTYEIVTPAANGSIGLENPNSGFQNAIPGSFIYVANAGFTGVDSFSYRACDFSSCSTPAEISISVSSGVAVNEIGIDLVAPGTGAASPITVVSGPTLDVIAPDTDANFSYPLGAFFFNVKDIPVGAAEVGTGTVVTLRLPAGTVISVDAVIRKLDKTGVWRTLGAGPDTAVTTGTIDVAANTITLVLRDNDIFDTDPALGSITDPVAIGVTKRATANSQVSGATSSSGGGGTLNLLVLAGLLLAYRRRLR
ncbi:MAG: choice-of-anchor Q domain-containing protein [Pseudomonadota bacterium]|nr:choice-of-anchor Q domain-containing protein [Pseudomonadota bacterium]